MKTYYKRHLPHIQLPHANYFVTFRLANTIPASAILRLRAEQKEFENHIRNRCSDYPIMADILENQRMLFYKIDDYLDRCHNDNNCLRKPGIAKIVSEAIHFYNNKFYDLIAYCIMPNHVHLVFTLISDGQFEACPTDIKTVGRTSVRPKGIIERTEGCPTKREYPVADVLKCIKSYTAREANKILKRTGAFWQHENYDHIIRNDNEMKRYIRYTLDNPVKAGLVKDWKNWQWSYCKYE